MLEELEKLTALWKQGALSDEEFEDQKVRLLANSDEPTTKSYGKTAMGVIGALILLGAGGGGVFMMHSRATPVAATGTDEPAESATDAPGDAEKDVAAADPSKIAAGPAQSTEPYVGHLRCVRPGGDYPVFSCLVESDRYAAGSVRFRSDGSVNQFTALDISTKLGGPAYDFQLGKSFQVEIQSNGDDFGKLRLEVTQGNKVVYSNEVNNYGVISVSSDEIQSGGA